MPGRITDRVDALVIVDGDTVAVMSCGTYCQQLIVGARPLEKRKPMCIFGAHGYTANELDSEILGKPREIAFATRNHLESVRF